jgi:hypothetical protein
MCSTLERTLARCQTRIVGSRPECVGGTGLVGVGCERVLHGCRVWVSGVRRMSPVAQKKNGCAFDAAPLEVEVAVPTVRCRRVRADRICRHSQTRIVISISQCHHPHNQGMTLCIPRIVTAPPVCIFSAVIHEHICELGGQRNRVQSSNKSTTFSLSQHHPHTAQQCASPPNPPTMSERDVQHLGCATLNCQPRSSHQPRINEQLTDMSQPFFVATKNPSNWTFPKSFFFLPGKCRKK